MTKRILMIVAATVLLLTGSILAQHDTTFFKRHQAGIRLGGWANHGGIPLASEVVGGDTYKSDIGSSSFYFEFSGAMRIFHRSYLELSVGFANRGEVSVLTSDSRSYFGNLIITPILIQFKYYPPISPIASFVPYVQAGGGLYSGRYNIEFSNDIAYQYAEQSVTDFNYVLGGGFDFPLGSSITLEANARYMPITFSDDLFSVKDYSATTITIGVRYLLLPKKDDNENKKR